MTTEVRGNYKIDHYFFAKVTDTFHRTLAAALYCGRACFLATCRYGKRVDAGTAARGSHETRH
jgi:hypothetical protein